MEFDYKIGDSVYCYNDFCNVHKKGNCYKIMNVEIYIGRYNDVTSVYVVGENTCVEVYNVYKNYPTYNYMSFYEYFLSKKEYRKFKLEKFKLEKFKLNINKNIF